MESSGATCEHCGGMVGDDGLAILLPDEPETAKHEEAEPEKRDFAVAVSKRKEA